LVPGPGIVELKELLVLALVEGSRNGTLVVRVFRNTRRDVMASRTEPGTQAEAIKQPPDRPTELDPETKSSSSKFAVL
jgi:hypothetical protein